MDNLNIVGFLWCINNYSKLPGTEIFSQCFWSSGQSWRLSVFPKGIKDKSDDYLSVFLEAIPSTSFKESEWKTDTFSATFFLRTEPDAPVDIVRRASKSAQEFSSNNPSWGFLRFCELERLYSLMKNDQLVVGITIRSIPSDSNVCIPKEISTTNQRYNSFYFNNYNNSFNKLNLRHSSSSSSLSSSNIANTHSKIKNELEFDKYLCSPPSSPTLSSKPKFVNNSLFEANPMNKYSQSTIELPPSYENEVYLIQIENKVKIFCPHLDRMFRVVKEFESEFNNDKTADVELIIEGKSIYAHKIILSARSNYFKAMFNSGMCESESSKITITDFKYSTIESLIKFLYSVKTEINDDLNELIELYRAADKYQLESLMNYIHQSICSRITCQNACSILSEIYCFPRLEKSCLEFIAQHLSTIYSTPDFRNLLSGGYEESLTTLFGMLVIGSNLNNS
ncbi:BTB-domain-containing protein [Anaeromyces robustus]|uniref:BTB-domain-containing protein n=1 Tax=Anaeromyces robustus TaxID=1754192 RepID=A0A1Y1WU28_9FUNG|nr:BTB-domain-containing protein [Anaeromyces robustus]|eukprot:ORX76818.1 BTB-domain-containing protein [Anaeromyces robustus]